MPNHVGKLIHQIHVATLASGLSIPGTVTVSATLVVRLRSTNNPRQHGNLAVPTAPIAYAFPWGCPWNGGTPNQEDQSIHHVWDLAELPHQTLTFKVVVFPGMYHAILRRPTYVKLMVVPNYTYLKLKIPGLKGVITMGATFQHAYNHDAECFQFPETLIRSEKLGAEPSPEISKSVRHPSVRRWPSPTMAARSVSGRCSILNRKARLLTSSERTSTCLHGNPWTCCGFQGRSPRTNSISSLV
jgi:hypothetical protein